MGWPSGDAVVERWRHEVVKHSSSDLVKGVVVGADLYAVGAPRGGKNDGEVGSTDWCRTVTDLVDEDSGQGHTGTSSG